MSIPLCGSPFHGILSSVTPLPLATELCSTPWERSVSGRPPQFRRVHIYVRVRMTTGILECRSRNRRSPLVPGHGSAPMHSSVRESQLVNEPWSEPGLSSYVTSVPIWLLLGTRPGASVHADIRVKIALTVVFPLKNEEANLGKCLSRLSRFSEVIVVDSSSTDCTPAIAKRIRCEHR